MFGAAWKELSGFLERRFVLTIWLPTFLFWTLLVTLWALSKGLDVALDWWTEQTLVVQLVLTFAGLGWITWWSYLLRAQLMSILRFYEGYWADSIVGGLKLVRAVENQRKMIYLKRLQALMPDVDADYQQIYYNYPPQDYVNFRWARDRMNILQPTQLGNILKSSEIHPLMRYNIDAVIVWPRLYSVLPAGFVANLAEAKSALDLMVIVSFLGGVFALIGGLVALIMLPWHIFLLCFWGGSLVACLGYRGCLSTARSYTEFVRTAFDVYRNRLLKEMGLKTPVSWEDDRDRWEQVSKLLYRMSPDNSSKLVYAQDNKPEHPVAGGS